jgi:hypothetical protein
MNMLDVLTSAGNGAAVRQIGSRLGLSEAQATSALSALLPALAGGMQRNAQTPDGLAGLTAALSSGRHQQYIDNPSMLGEASSIADGNGILGHILGSKDVSRQVATQASATTGIGADVLKQMLPMVAALMMGGLSQRNTQSGSPLGIQAGGGGLMGMLGGLLDQNKDGSVLDDLTGLMGRKFDA